MNSIFDKLLDDLEDNHFEEKPVDVKTFCYSPDYLGLKKLSPIQERLVELMSQVYRREDLVKLYGEDEADRLMSLTVNEVVMMFGKGAGKDFTSTVGCAYLVYKLLCLKDPADYFEQESGDSIDIINIAINAKQANKVFFRNFKNKIEKSPWFRGKYDLKADFISFDKEITVWSGHSERESWEGYNTILVILDEIAGFAMETTLSSETAKTAEAVYKMYKGSVSSRYKSPIGKTVLLSFPRYKGDFINKRYNDVVKEKEVRKMQHTYKINEELPDGIEENEFTIEWDEDHILEYSEPNVYALKRPSWDVNPRMNIEDYIGDFLRDPVDALSRFACMAPDAVDAFFRSRENVEEAFSGWDDLLDQGGNLRTEVEPDPKKEYFIHVDLAQKVDHCAVAMGHVDGWAEVSAGAYRQVEPRIKIDFIKFWKPDRNDPLDLDLVTEFILEVWRKGYNLRAVTFDRWGSVQTIKDLRSYGINADTLSVNMDKGYIELLQAVNEKRIKGPKVETLINELLELKVHHSARRIDHPSKGSKDLSDAVAGVVHNINKYSKRTFTDEIEVYAPDAPQLDKKYKADDTVIEIPGKRGRDSEMDFTNMRLL